MDEKCTCKGVDEVGSISLPEDMEDGGLVEKGKKRDIFHAIHRRDVHFLHILLLHLNQHTSVETKHLKNYFPATCHNNHRGPRERGLTGECDESEGTGGESKGHKPQERFQMFVCIYKWFNL